MTSTSVGPSPVAVSPITLGANPFGWTSDQATSHRVLDAYVAGGGTSIDTSDSYGAGASEEILGAWLSAAGRRDEVFVASKVSRHPDRRGLAPDNVRLAVEESLGRLRTDRLDLLWAHYDDPDVPLADTLGAFQELLDQGSVLAVGISNYSPDRIREWLSIVADQGLTPPVALQPQYSLLRRHELEDERLGLAREHGLAVFPYWVLASGLLTGKYSSAEGISGSARESILGNYAADEAFAVVDIVRAVAQDHDVEPTSVALAWALAQDGVTSPIASVSRPEQLDAVLAATDLTLSADELGRLDEASRAVDQ